MVRSLRDFEITIYRYFVKNMARAKTYTQYKFEFESLITGHHVYKDIWTPVIGEELQCYMEDDNPHDRYAIKLVNKNNAI